jgi:uncharacterized protein
MDTSEKIVAIIREHYPSAQAVYLFGTFGTEFERPDSDIDVAVLLPPEEAVKETNMILSQCRFDLENSLSKPVDLLNLRQVSTVFQIEIIRSGAVIHRADRDAVDEFEMLALSHYQKLNEERRGILDAFEKTGRAYSV